MSCRPAQQLFPFGSIYASSNRGEIRVSAVVQPSSRSPAPAGGPFGSREIAGSRRAARHLRASFSVFLEIDAQPTGGEAAVAGKCFPCDQCRQLERLRDRHAADLPCGHRGEYEVVVFQRPLQDRSRVALRGRRSSSPGPKRCVPRLRSSPGPRLSGAEMLGQRADIRVRQRRLNRVADRRDPRARRLGGDPEQLARHRSGDGGLAPL